MFKSTIRSQRKSYFWPNLKEETSDDKDEEINKIISNHEEKLPKFLSLYEEYLNLFF